jgi:hypothetical protein
VPVSWKHGAAKLLAEPTVRFFVIGALLFVAHRLITGDPRVVVVTPGVRSELGRRFRDHNGRPPTSAELDDELRAWERDEALYREAIRERLDRDDATIRTVLADRARARAALAIPRREPTQGDLDAWLAAHSGLYEEPRRYDYETVAFSSALSSASASAERERYERALNGGVNPGKLGRPVVGGVLTSEELSARLGPDLAARIRSLPVGAWQRLDGGDALLLARVNAVAGGLPAADELHRRLVADWSFAEQRRAVDQAVQAIVDRYRVEVRR